MPTKPSVDIQTANTQAKSRKLVTLRDPHKSARFPDGRPWWGYVEMPAERGGLWGVVGCLQPGNHERPFEDAWDAPWLPDAKWMKPNIERGTVEILYVGITVEYTNATRKYYERCAEVAHENKWLAPQFGGPVDSRFRAVVGRDVPQSPKIPQAAQAGDPWLLGFTSEINESLSKILRATTYGSGMRVIEAPAAVDAGPAQPTPDIQAMIDDAVAKALAAVAPSAEKAAAAQRMRDAKAAKAAKAAKQAQAQAQAA